MSEKHTPGDWRTEAVSDAVRVVVGEGRKKIILARLSPRQLPEQETHANARVMAIAPELLEVCTHLSNIPLTEIHPDYHPWFKAMHAAIAKAEGR